MVLVLLVSVPFSRTPYHPYIGVVGSISWRGGIKSGEELKWHQRASQGTHFSPQNTAKTNHKSTNLRKNNISDVAFASVNAEKTRMKKLMIMIVINIKNHKKRWFLVSARN